MTEAESGETSAPVPDGPIVWIASRIIWISNFFSAARLIRCLTSRKPPDSEFYGYYVLGWTALLLGLLIWAPMSGNWGLAAVSLALYRLQDMLLGTIGDVFSKGPYNGSARSKVAVVVINIVQVVIIFAIAYMGFTISSDFRPGVSPSRFGYFYLSWNSLPPLGSGFVPTTLPARIIATIESGIGTLLIVVALSRFLGKDDKPTVSLPRTTEAGRAAPHRRQVSWAAVAVIITGFIVGGVALVAGPIWWLFCTGTVIVVVGGIIALPCPIFED